MRHKIDLICSGTGGSFISMAGAYKALLEHEFDVRRCACTSGSAITMAFLVAQQWSPDAFLELCLATKFENMIKFGFFHPAWGYLYDNRPMIKWIDDTLGGATLGDMKIDVFCVNVTDIDTGEMFVLSNLNEPDMKLAQAIAGTTAIPGLFPPMLHKGRYFVDGGVTQNLMIGVFDDMSVRMKLAFLERGEQKTQMDISSKLRENILPGMGKKPSILTNTVKSIHFLMNSLLEAQLRERKNTITVEIPTIRTKHEFYLTNEEKTCLFETAYSQVARYLEENT